MHKVSYVLSVRTREQRPSCILRHETGSRSERQPPGIKNAGAFSSNAPRPDSTSTQVLRQIVRETLRSVTHTNAARMCQTAATGQCPDSMSHRAEPDEQDIEVIPGGSRYWEDWEKEVQYNSGRSSTTVVAPKLPSETSNQPPGEYSGTENNNNRGSPNRRVQLQVR